MKWRRFVSSMGLSKLFKGLLALAMIKLCLLAMVGWHTLSVPPGTAPSQTVVKVASVGVSSPAQAQDGVKDNMLTMEDQEKTKTAPMGAAALQKRQEELDRRERELNTLESKIKRDMAELDKRRAQMERMLEDAKAVRDKKDRHLVDVFSNMKSKQAAQVLESMDERQAVKILSGMRGRQAGEILTFVQAEKAAKLAEALTRLQVPFE
ncbi:MotE family protein [Desulfovibrio ferrophilus]|uniref:Magnesium transporter MgtE intracellular domain-containing protein n=1 Tax=Desulfovibrio ferrophilus TaxID=241368 RepID=A0A2Z6B2E0_9BACT|nr:hypothetical protein [Desulfovibrio ferrophilus]BBD09623.1 uncharacterized protein DFE_2897 [Desulfovibrio ferrophilus]